MSYEGISYFAGPKTKWSKKISADEIISRHPARWLWLARAQARATHKRLDPTRCGYVVLKDGEAVEHVEARK